jgi:hypothetical protein
MSRRRAVHGVLSSHTLAGPFFSATGRPGLQPGASPLQAVRLQSVSGRSTRTRRAKHRPSGPRNRMPALEDVLDDCYQRVAVTQRAHYLSADYFGARKLLAWRPGGRPLDACWHVGVCNGPETARTVASNCRRPFECCRCPPDEPTDFTRLFRASRETSTRRRRVRSSRSRTRATSCFRIDALHGSYVRRSKAPRRSAVESPNNPLHIYRKAGSSGLEPTKRAA